MRELRRWHIPADLASLDALGQEALLEVAEFVLSPSGVRALVHECHQVGAVVVMSHPVEDGSIGSQYRFESFECRAGPVAQCSQLVQVMGNVLGVPGHQDGLDIGEVLIRGGPPDPGCLGRGNRAQALLDDHLTHCVSDAVRKGGDEATEKLSEASAAIGRLVRS